MRRHGDRVAVEAARDDVVHRDDVAERLLDRETPGGELDEVGDPAAGLRIVTTVNGKIAQFGKTSDMLSASVSVDLEKIGSIRTPVV